MYYRTVSRILSTEAYLGNSAYILGAAEELQRGIQKIGITPQIRANRINEMQAFYLESILKESEWFMELAKRESILRSPSLTKAQRTNLGHVTRQCVEGLRFIEDYVRESVNGKYDCHDLCVLAKVKDNRGLGFIEMGAGFFGGVKMSHAVLKATTELLAKNPLKGNNAKYADFIREKINLEETVAEEFLDELGK